MHRPTCAIASLVVALSVVIGLGSNAAAMSCAVRNARDGTTFTVLQEAVDAAMDSDMLRVRGVCVGSTVILDKSLRLRGIPTTAYPTPTLDGGGVDRVLGLRSADLVLVDLTVTNGFNIFGTGAGILNSGGRLTLRGSTTVTGNTATRPEDNPPAAGILNGEGGTGHDGLLILRDTASVSGNTAIGEDGCAGGIANDPGRVVLNDSSTVAGNSPGGICWGSVELNDSASVTGNRHGGIRWAQQVVMNDSASVSGNRHGGISTWGSLILNGSASVTGNTISRYGGGVFVYGAGSVTLNGSATISGNTAGRTGGGIYFSGRSAGTRTLWLNDEASITGNTAGIAGGGIYLDPRGPSLVYLCSDLVAISPNDPDDPPETLPCT